jgi:hypothetical protein
MIWICLKKPCQAPPEDECCWGMQKLQLSHLSFGVRSRGLILFLKGYSNYFTHILCFLCIWRNPIDHYRVSCARQHARRCAWRGSQGRAWLSLAAIRVATLLLGLLHLRGCTGWMPLMLVCVAAVLGYAVSSLY